MGLVVIFFFILIPVAEIATLIAVGDAIGFFPTLLLLIGAGLLGALLLRIQGLDMVMRLRLSLARREPPTAVLFDGLCLALAGILLVLPGLLSDALAILLLLPPVRAMLRALVLRSAAPAAPPEVIEGSFTDVTPTAPPRRLPPDRFE